MTVGEGGRAFATLQARRRLARVGRVILVGSGKGGVGKSLVACALALQLSKSGHGAAILDADLHGASVPGIMGTGAPLSSSKDGITPKLVEGVEIMSVALFTGGMAVPIGGGEKREVITQMVALTDWGDLDFMVVDLPPGTGDEVLAAFSLFSGAPLILVTTPAASSLSIVSRLGKLARTEKVPIAGVVLNMAHARTGRTVLYPFGRADRRRITELLGARILAEVPLEASVNSTGLGRALRAKSEFSAAFKGLAEALAAERVN